MKQIYTLTFFLCLGICQAIGQLSFADDFEPYAVGSYLGTSNPKWTTWSNKPGTTEDAIITNEEAKSGTKSIKIFSTLVGGGPQDVILPFGGKRTSGRFVYGMSLYIPDGKNGYFNFQGEAAVGQVWSLNTNFNEDGSIVMSTAGGVNLFTGTFNHDEWFDLQIDVNLNNNQWTVSLNGTCRGTFINSINTIASIDLFPVNNKSLFYVDDVSFEYDPVAPSYTTDVSISGVFLKGGKLSGTKTTYSYIVKNNGSSTINSLDLFIEIDGVKYPISLTGLAIASGGSQTFLYAEETIVKEGVNVTIVSIDKINGVKGDEFSCDDASYFTFAAGKAALHRAILVEEGTGTWCQWCVRGSVFMDRLSETYEGLFIPVAVHNADPMTVTEYDAFVAFSAFPNARLNRSIEGDPSVMEAPFLTEIVKPVNAKLDAGATYDPSSGIFTVQTNVEFVKDAANSQYWINVIVTEDGVKGTTAGYNQSNAYAGGAQGEMGGYELLPASVPAALMTYDHVARAIFGLTQADTKFTGVYKNGDKKNITLTGNIGANRAVANMHVIPVLMSIKGYENAIQLPMVDVLAKGVTATENIIKDNQVSVYPNPVDDMLTFEVDLGSASDLSITIADVSGRVVATKKYGKLSGKHYLPVNVNQLNPGVYTAMIDTKEGRRIEKIVVQ